MAEAVVGSTIEVLLQQLIAVSAEEINLFKNFSKDLQKLKDSAAMIRDFLEDAETKVVADKSVKRWLGKLEAVAFEADYVFDKLNYHVLRKKVERGSKMKKKVRCFVPNTKSLSFRHRMARKIKEINEELKSINEEATHLRLERIVESAPDSLHIDLVGRETDSVSIDRVFVGRENDAMKIVEMVNNSPTKNKLSVIPIVGMGGLGKTTLARNVYHHDNIVSRFENRIWVYVSEKFVPETLFKKVYLSLTGKDVGGNRDVLLRELRGEIGDKRYFLVLDDIWNDDTEKWDNFITSLEAISPPKGNVVLITTRKGNVASIVKTNDVHELGVLSEEDCWQIIKAKAFGEEEIPSGFESICEKITEKCGGLPLAAKVVGGLLRGKSENEWHKIEKKWVLDFGDDADNFTKILKLSFDNLPSSSMKKCFAFCSIIPKGWSIEKDEIIHLWMAEGLLQTDTDKDIEIVGNSVFEVLLRNSLLQVEERDYFGNVISFRLHDLVHDLASSILNSQFLGGAHKVRYICKAFTDQSSPIPKEHSKYLRALFFSGKISHIMFSNLTRLHVLIPNDGEMKELPSEIGKLICLRYLDISHTKMECLPDSIGYLYQLQTLRATQDYGGKGCLRKLPRTLKFLTNLRHLYIPNIELPPEIGKLSSLQTLPYFQVGDEEGCGITELKSLKNLKGKIEIHNLEKVRDKEEAQNAELLHKVDMVKLKLVWNESREDDQNNDENVLEGLQPHRDLESLEIEGFKGSSFPLWTLRMEVREDRWIRLDKLLEITLANCRGCEELPMMGHLSRLRSVSLSGLSKVKTIGFSFYGIKEVDINKETTIIVFPALEKLELIDMEDLSAWTEVDLLQTQPRAVSMFRHLEYLKISDCRKLKSAPTHFPILKELEIENMESGQPLATMFGSKLTSLTKLEIRGVDELVCLPDGLFSSNRNLLELFVSNCSNLTHLVQFFGGRGASLRKLMIVDCPNFEKLPEDLHKLNALEEFLMYGCPNLKSIANPSDKQGFTSLQELEIWNCSGLTYFPCEMLQLCALSLERLLLTGSSSLTNFPQVMSCLHKMPRLNYLAIDLIPKLDDVVLEIGSLCSVKRLDIGGCGDYASFHASLDRIFPAFPCLSELELLGMEDWDDLPDQLQHLTTLCWLCLRDFGVQVLPEWLGKLTSLRILYLYNCKKLRHLPSKKAIQDLTRLEVSECPLLKQNLEEDRSDNSEWSKLSNITNITVDDVDLRADAE